MYIATQSFKNMMLSSSYSLYVKIEIYDSKMKFIKTITQQVKNDMGTLAVNGDSPIRRSFKLNLDNSNGEFTFGDKNMIWLDKRVKLFVGLSTWNTSIEWVPLGVFVLTEPENSHLSDGNNATINAVDKAYLMTDNRGKFVNEHKVNKGDLITTQIKAIAQLAGETLFNFDTPVIDTSVTPNRNYNVVPYEIVYNGDSNYWTAIQELAELAKCSIYYDCTGYLRLKNLDFDEIDKSASTWTYSYGDSKEKLYAGNTRTMGTSQLFNDIVVMAGGSANKVAKFRITVDETNSIWKDHPYSIQKIGRNTYLHNGNTPDPALVTEADCKNMAKKLLMKYLGYDEQLQLNAAPNYLHDVDDVIFIEDSENGVTGNKYVIRSINLPISPQLMTLDVVRYKRVLSDWNFI